VHTMVEEFEWLFQPSIFMTAISGFVPLDSLLRHNVVGSVTWPTYVQTDVVSQGKAPKATNSVDLLES